jgi:hypothetical protein
MPLALYDVGRHMYVSVAWVGQQMQFNYTEKPTEFYESKEQWFSRYNLRDTYGMCLVKLKAERLLRG